MSAVIVHPPVAVASSSSSHHYQNLSSIIRSPRFIYLCVFLFAVAVFVFLTPSPHHADSHDPAFGSNNHQQDSSSSSSIDQSENRNQMCAFLGRREARVELLAQRAVRFARKTTLRGSPRSWVSPKAVPASRRPAVSSLSELHNVLFSSSAQIAAQHAQDAVSPVGAVVVAAAEQKHPILAKTEFENLFSFKIVPSKLRLIGADMKEKARNMFAAYPKPAKKQNSASAAAAEAGDDALNSVVRHIEEQHVIQVTNLATNEQSLFNPLRNYRPGAMQSLTTEQDAQIDKMYLEREGKDGCDFCDGLKKTAEDVPFGRFIGKRCFTSANIGKLYRWHSLLISSSTHHPLRFDVDDVRDWFAVSKKYFQRANIVDPSVRFPTLIFDAGARASASQAHLHIHLMLTPHMYLTGMQNLMESAYEWSYGGGADATSCKKSATEGGEGEMGKSDKSNDKEKQKLGVLQTKEYFAEWIRAHDAVGLALQHGSAWLVASMTPIHDKEVFVIGSSASPEFAELVFFALHCLIHSEKLHVRAFSMSAALEEMRVTSSFSAGGAGGAGTDKQNHHHHHHHDGNRKTRSFPHMPAVVRMMDRGSPLDSRNDAGALEFYGSFNVATDPYRIMAEARAMWCDMPFAQCKAKT